MLSALEHFAAELSAAGYGVLLDDAPCYIVGIRQHVARTGACSVVVMAPREWGLLQALWRAAASGLLGAPLTLHDSGGARGHFLLERDAFADWAKGRLQIRMHHFYSFMRKRTGWLMDGGKPLGGRWSFYRDNRRHARGVPPQRPRLPPDATTRCILEQVARWSGHWGRVEPFDWPVTRAQALAELDDFFAARAEGRGPYQDAMTEGRPFLWHTRLSAAMYLGLIAPREVCERIVAEPAAGRMLLASAEDLPRQIAGWREFIAMLAGIVPIDISHWFWAAFVDAFEWVELPNVHGMAVFADDTFTTKPYAASGKYIAKMSDYCGDCVYDVNARSGQDACPFNPLYWDFLRRHRKRFEANPRMRMIYRSWDRFSEQERRAIETTAARFKRTLTPSEEDWRFDDDAC